MQIKRIVYQTVGPVLLVCLIGCGGSDTPVLLEPVPLTQEESAQEGKESPDAQVSAGSSTGTEGISSSGGMGEEAAERRTVMVHVCGAVRYPGVYELPADARVADAMIAAGDLMPDASPDYWNQAAVLTDGEQIYVPTVEEAEAGDVPAGVSSPGAGGKGAAAAGAADASDGRIDLNTADAKLLKTLPGIGDVKAGAIIAFREAHGGFTSVEEVKQVDGIKDALFSQIEPLICVR